MEKRDNIVFNLGTTEKPNYRVNKSLNMSRSTCEIHDRVNNRPKIIYLPLNLLPPGIKALCIACDGAFDALSSNFVAEHLYHNIQKDPYDLKFATRSILVDAYDNGSTDNISALVVDLNTKAIFNPSLTKKKKNKNIKHHCHHAF